MKRALLVNVSLRAINLILGVTLLAATPATLNAQTPRVCFSGVVRPACSGFLLFEGNAVASGGSSEFTLNTTVPTTTGPIILAHRIRDLPGYYSGSLGYVHVVGSKTAVGAVAELGFSNTSELGNAHRVAGTVRVRRWLGDAVLDVGAGPLGVEVFTASRSGDCCTDKVKAYGATIETALTYRSLAGVTLGADLVRGAGRTSTGVHAGVRVGSYGAVAAAVITAALGALAYYALSSSDY